MQVTGRFGEQILVQESAVGQSRRTKFALIWAIFVAGIFCIGFTVLMLEELFASAYERELFYLIGGGALAAGCFALVVFLIRSLLRYSQKMRAVVYEFGLAHIIGTEVTEIDFRDIKGMQDMLLVLDDTDIEIGTRIFTILKKDHTEFELSQYEVPAYEEFFYTLRQSFCDYLLEGVSDETLHRINIWFGGKLELRGERLIYHHPGEGRGWTDIPLDAVHAISPFEARSDSSVQLVGADAEVLVEIPFDEMFNVDVLYWMINDFR